MILTISQYIEALASPDGRWRTLRRIHPVTDPSGGPLFAMPGHGFVDLEVTAGCVRQTLRCPLLWDGAVAARLEAFVRMDRGLGGRFFTEWRVLRSEVVLFDDYGGPSEVDILARPAREGEPLVDFLEKAAAAGDTDAMEAAEESFERLVAWARRVGRGGIALRRLVTSPDGEVSLTAFSATDDTDAVYRYMRRLKLHGECLEKSADRNRPTVRDEYEEYTWDDHWGVATVMNEGCWSLLDDAGNRLTAEHYEWMGECSEGLVLAQKGQKCGFIDLSGREVIPFIYDVASSFSEGCAVVTLAGETCLIDPRGKRI